MGLFALMALMVGLLAGCGNAAPKPEPIRPVLVVQAGAAEGVPMLTAYSGEVRAREETSLAFRVGGKVLARYVDLGDRVREGDVLAELDPTDLRLQADALGAQVASAEAQLVRARADYARVAALAKDQLVSRSALDQQTASLRAAEAQVRAARAQSNVAGNQSAYSALRAPRAGAIAGRQIEAGQVVAAGQPAFVLAADSGREIAFALPESKIREVSVGQQVLVELWSAPQQRLTGRIREIAPMADPLARTYAARAALDGGQATDAGLGQSARVYIVGAERAALQVPLTAIQAIDRTSPAVWVADPKTQRVRKVPVRIGAFGPESVPVLSGLKASDWVVVAGGHLLQDGQSVVPIDRDNRPVKAN
ncbi:MAG: efflux RND transporter periplasmic adaptor subunit [Lysobacter sp.]|nr:efflux RND transporter periplasmic adaptor subunit [Lysobacter sp.]